MIPVLWDEVATGLDGQMLASGGGCLENCCHAEKAYPELLTAEALKKNRKGEEWVKSLLGIPIGVLPTPPTRRVNYRLEGSGQKPTRAIFASDLPNPRAWFEQRLGPIAYFEFER